MQGTKTSLTSINHFEKNTVGKDYVVGDIHGCYTQLQQELDAIGFDHKTDRLFSVGDLVDRGPESELSMEWLAKPWFHAVRGNHDQMAIDAVEGFYEPSNYLANGGAWFLGLPDGHRRLFADLFNTLPLWIEVETDKGLVGIIHGDGPTDWQHVDKLNPHWLLWGRARHSRKDTTPVKNVYRVYCGHTPVKEELVDGNTHFIDTGAVYGKKFTIVRIQ